MCLRFKEFRNEKSMVAIMYYTIIYNNIFSYKK